MQTLKAVSMQMFAIMFRDCVCSYLPALGAVFWEVVKEICAPWLI